ncbi:MAG: MBL fold metallo-hydrolase [Puniceicoccales bacterium]|jgi:phosphoribosyl 1,2-cyclic phosphate phosphodiesterase|nr:MBL fold metallo-hydrolase [Puniceicoccales bacterium]
MEIIFLGTGTSQGVPLPAHPNPGLDRANPKNWRTRASVHVIIDGVHVQVDAGPDFRWQCLQNDISAVDFLLLTHEHTDHMAGLDDMRCYYNLREGAPIPLYSTRSGLERVRAFMPYAIRETPRKSGYVEFSLREMPATLTLDGGARIHSVRLPHGRTQTLGLVFIESSTGARFVYYSDCKEVTPEAEALAHGADVVVLDGLRPETHPTHMTVGEAVLAAERIQGRRTFITHTTYQLDYGTWAPVLAADNVEIAYDGLRLQLG